MQFSGFYERVRKMHHMRGVKRPAGMGGPHCDHSPSSLICSHYPYQRLKIKNKDRESDGGQREAAGEREWGGGVRGGGRNNETVGFARVWMCVLAAIAPPPFGCGSVGWRQCWGVGGVGRRVDKGDSTLKPTKLQKQ